MVDVELLFRHSGIVVTRWRCRATSAIDHQWRSVTFVHTGALQAQLDDGAVQVDPTRVLLAPPGTPYRVTRQFGAEVSGSAILVAPGMTPEIEGARLLCEELTLRAILIQHLILRKIETCASPLAIAELALMLAMEAFRNPDSRAKVKQTRAVTMAQALLAANFEKPVRLEDIARAVDLSPCHLCRMFKRITGMHMHQYLNRLRLRAALERVVESGPDFAEIAYAYGFSSHSHFAAAFRKELRITPSQARRLAAGGVAELRRILELHE